ncbi:Zinc finger in N-recognin family protein [Trichomonas vaginalis G3]|uniref:E3 ubiquitin-protein ligase n=1 Tax=Trichomonas vaginalis (strain ATCC PRA-98 / G3) TaxID=412133 RepID=A2FSA3_TRIV3|nr:E3 ubiquitin-protein ligase family [Trichomonas vaginalis G3]EAX92219.1 Zinc finger in N-recognin family protein [Trichomonas vaginalis G3]KAI5551171.1 E3 ubiquitin-protein ligase family [Trichomonas vaginalis G3]|eukprot:XP_001305149.1 Zinc finger in N-recognin family protein [Trichomonas vaginalis G3]
MFNLYHQDDPYKDELEDIEEALLGSRFSDFDEMEDFYRSKYPSSKCNNSWFKDCLSFNCEECRLSSNSCICYDCFRHSNHEGHHVKCHINQSGNCDCGDTNFWKEESFCTKHHKQSEHPEALLTEQEQSDFFIAFSTAALFLQDAPNSGALTIIRWLKRFTTFGDPVLRCFSMAICPACTVELHLRLHSDALTALLALESSIVNEIYFDRTFLPYLLSELPKILKAPIRDENENIAGFFFHCYSSVIIDIFLRDSSWISSVREALFALYDLYSRVTNCHSYTQSAISSFISEYQSFIQRIVQKPEVTDEQKRMLGDVYIDYLELFPYRVNFNRIPTGDKVDDDEEDPTIVHLLTLCYIDYCTITLAPYLDKERMLISLYKLHKKQPISDNNCPANPENTVHLMQVLCVSTYIALVDAKEFRPIFENAAKKLDVSLDDFCSVIASLPMRAFVGHYYSEKNFFARNATIISIAFRVLHSDNCIKDIWVPMFGMVQICAGIMSTEKFLELVDSTFAVERDDADYIHFLTTISLQRLGFDYSDLNFLKILTFIMIRIRPIPLHYVLNRLYINTSVVDINKEIREICNKFESDDVFVRLKDENFLPYYNSFFNLPLLREMIQVFTSKNKASLFPLTVDSDYNDLKLLRYICTKKWNYAAENLMLKNDTDMIHFLMPVFVLKHQKSAEIIKDEPKKEIFETDLKELFMTKQEGKLFKMISQLGIPGEEFLRRINVGEIKMNEDTINEKKKIAREMRLKAIAEMQRQQSSFLGNIDDESSDDENMDEDICPICQQPNDLKSQDIVGFPVLATYGPTETYGFNFTIPQIRYFPCNHHLHRKCVPAMLFDCPLDRGHCNAICPLIPDDVDECNITNSNLANACFEFLDNIHADIRNALDGIINEIAVLEFRHLINPNCFMGYNFTGLRNIWRVIRLVIKYDHLYSDPPEVIETESGPRELPEYYCHEIFYSLACLENQDYKDIKKFTLELLKSHNEMNPVVLRRLAIFYQFILKIELVKQNEMKDVDWDEVLDINNLLDFFEIKDENDRKQFLNYKDSTNRVSLKIRLPKTIIDFMEPPFEINIANKIQTYLVLDGNNAGEIVSANQLSRLLMNPFNLLIDVSADRLSSVLVFGHKSYYALPSPYINDYGDEDIGMTQGFILKLDQQRFEKLLDIWFSAKYARIIYLDGL